MLTWKVNLSHIGLYAHRVKVAKLNSSRIMNNNNSKINNNIMVSNGKMLVIIRVLQAITLKEEQFQMGIVPSHQCLNNNRINNLIMKNKTQILHHWSQLCLKNQIRTLKDNPFMWAYEILAEVLLTFTLKFRFIKH